MELKIVSAVLMFIVIMVLGFGAPNTVMAYESDIVSLMSADLPEDGIYTPSTAKEQAIIEAEAKAKDKARFEQNAMDFYNKSLEYETACPNGGNYTLEDFMSSIYGVDKTCVDPDQEIKGAIILFK